MSKYLVIDNYNSINEEFETIEEAFAQAEACIEDAGIDGWPQEILDGCVKICIVTHQSSPQNMRDTKNPDWDFECDVEMTETEHYIEIKKLQHQLEIQTKRVENLKEYVKLHLPPIFDSGCEGCRCAESASVKGLKVDQELEKQLEEANG